MSGHARVDYVEVIDVAVGRMQRHFEPMRQEIDAWKGHNLSDQAAKLLIYGFQLELAQEDRTRKVVALPRLDGLHHRYCRRAA